MCTNFAPLLAAIYAEPCAKQLTTCSYIDDDLSRI